MQRRTARGIMRAKGWAFIGNNRKAHAYHQDDRSVCGTHVGAFYGGEYERIDSAPSPDDCAVCRRKVDEAMAVSDS